MYALCVAYRAFLGRMAVQLMGGLRTGEFGPWLEDDGIKQILRSVLTVEEAQRLEKMPIGAFGQTIQIFERKIMLQMGKVVSGETSADLHLAKAQEIAQAASDAERVSRDEAGT